MVSHALNIVDPRNWRSVDQPDGTQAMEYVVPEEEERHLAPLSKEFEDQHADELLQYPHHVGVGKSDQVFARPG